MGMFDYVRCEVRLPDGFDGELQTKDFDCPYMERYTITAEGRLMKRVVVGSEPTPESEWKYTADDPDTMHQIWRHRSMTKYIYAEQDENFHGILNFYGGTANEWHEYNAKFTDGRLVEIKQIPDSDSDGQVNFSNESESDAVSLSQTFSSQPKPGKE